MGKVRRGRKGEEPPPFQFARNKEGSRPGVWEQEELWGRVGCPLRKAPGEGTWGHQWPEGHALE